MRTIKIALGHVYANQSQQYLVTDEIESAVRLALIDAGFRSPDHPEEKPVDCVMSITFEEDSCPS